MRMNPFGRGTRRNAGPRRHGGGIRWWVLLLFAGYGVYYWFSNRVEDPFTGETVLIDTSIQQEQALGLQAYQQILAQEQPVDPNSQIARQINGIAQRLVDKADEIETALAAEHQQQPRYLSRDFDWAVNVIDSPQVNAFCLPGGKMAVYTGLVPVAENADAMAVVMGHEIAHALLRHGAQRMASQKLAQMGQMAAGMAGMDPSQQRMVMAAMGYGVLLPYAREHETEADEVGLMLAAAACFDPREAVPLWERMAKASGERSQPEFASTHPNPGTRIDNLQALMPKALEYQQRFCEQADASGAP